MFLVDEKSLEQGVSTWARCQGADYLHQILGTTSSLSLDFLSIIVQGLQQGSAGNYPRRWSLTMDYQDMCSEVVQTRRGTVNSPCA